MRKLLAVILLGLVSTSVNASVLYSFDGVIATTTVDMTGDNRYAGWNLGQDIHGSFLWDPESATAESPNCYRNAIKGWTITTEYTIVIPFDVDVCGFDGYIDLIGFQQNVFGAVVPPGLLDDVVIRLDSSTLQTWNGLPANLSDYDITALGFAWIVPYYDVGTSVEFRRQSVPEPTPIVLMFAGLAMFLVQRRKLRA